ncbi:MAG: hypothetical protein L0271_00230, partial [Gemmatimonadetes bacterium]|nr:hypothetical protein [Gemmatimonadota bacterium]
MSAATDATLAAAIEQKLDALRICRDAALRQIDDTGMIEGAPTDGQPLTLAHVLYLWLDHGPL